MERHQEKNLRAIGIELEMEKRLFLREAKKVSFDKKKRGKGGAVGKEKRGGPGFMRPSSTRPLGRKYDGRFLERDLLCLGCSKRGTTRSGKVAEVIARKKREVDQLTAASRHNSGRGGERTSVICPRKGKEFVQLERGFRRKQSQISRREGGTRRRQARFRGNGPIGGEGRVARLGEKKKEVRYFKKEGKRAACVRRCRRLSV